uniref:Glycosyltransferase n=1 Tax=candidate division WOR-3 bacterium TaxID=2052148 RepID=A0A7V0Z7E0_UNCW3
MKILLLAVPIGVGHMKAANAIKQGIERLAPESQVRLEDCFKWVFPVYGFMYKNIYEYCQKNATWILKIFYQGMGVKSGGNKTLYAFHKITAYRFSDLIQEYKPDYVLCAHFSPAYYSALYKNNFGFRIGVVITDYYIHPHWVNKEIDDYFIPNEDLSGQILKYGAKAAQIYPFGIPVNIALEGEIDRDAARKRFGLSLERISVVVMGSKVFGGEWFEIVQEIVDFDYDLLVLCGENKEAMERIKKLKGRANLKVYGMVDKIQELIAVCDILITKAGGITTTEATKAGPCLLFANSIPGLEDKNEEFFIKHNAGLKITKENAKKVMYELLSQREKIAEMKKNLLKLGKKNSALNIAQAILKRGQAPLL